jgi:hypothetical protein
LEIIWIEIVPSANVWFAVILVHPSSSAIPYSLVKWYHTIQDFLILLRTFQNTEPELALRRGFLIRERRIRICQIGTGTRRQEIYDWGQTVFFEGTADLRGTYIIWLAF